MKKAVSYLKFLVKTRIVSPLRALFVSMFGGRVNTPGWDDRMLIINLEALGDLVVFTSVLKHFKKRFPDKKIYLVIKKGFGIEEIFKGLYVDEVITLDYRKFSVNPLYGAKFIGHLRNIGFKKVINHDWSAAEINGKYIATGVGADEVIGYEGLGIEFTRPFDIQQVKNMRVVLRKLNPRYTKIIPSIDAMRGNAKEIPSALRHYIAIYEEATGFHEKDYSTTLPTSRVMPEGMDAVSRFGLTGKRYGILGVNASVAYKRWPLEEFAKVAQFFARHDLDIVLAGAPKEVELARHFESIAGTKLVNAVGKTSIHDLIQLVESAAYVVTNDSSIVHFAVALKVPSVCITGGGQFGMFSNYGDENLNRWVYRETNCFGDNWLCGRDALPGNPSPCIAAIKAEDVLDELETLFDFVSKNKKAHVEGKGEFRLGADVSLITPKEKNTLKIVYAGVQAENYNPGRMPSFEYSNFFLTLKNMKGVSVVECPYDPIIGMGKWKWNEKLVELVRNEKPDLFFAFMFSDELDAGTLDEIKNLTTSVAWFADDHWRLWNYSRHYAPHFTHAVTTWSRAPEIYKNCGVANVLRSQWAANVREWKPIGAKHDIDVSFVGQYNPSRAEIIRKLREAGINVYVRGWGWPEGRANHEEILDIFSRSKIILNISDPPSRFSTKSLARLFLRRSQGSLRINLNLIENFRSWQHMGIAQIKARPFEVLACKAFVLSSRADDIETYYEDKKEIVYYDGIDDLIEKIKEYLPREKERGEIANAGYARTLRENTYEKRFTELFKVINLKLPVDSHKL